MALALEGFTDISTILKCGVYALAWRGEVVYIGQSKSMLARIYTHRSINRRKSDVPSWLPVKNITFDEIHIAPCHPDRVDALEAAMINRYKPRHNVRLKRPGPIVGPVTLNINGVALVLNSNPPPPRFERRI